MKSRKTYAKYDFIRDFAKNLAVTQTQAEHIYNVYLQTLSDGLQTGKPVLVGNLLRLQVKVRAERRCINPKTKEYMMRPARKYVKCKATTEFEKAMAQWQTS